MKLKKLIILFICIFIIIANILPMSTKGINNDEIQQSIAHKIIRFHVIANSDTKEDQDLKIKIKDRIIEYLQPKLVNCKNIEESRRILMQNNDSVKKIALSIINKEGYNYKVTTSLSKENFPVKTYGNITLPQGEYNAYRVIIGNGNGHNWWCVMFPPLCFIDITKGEVSYDKTETQMRRVLSEEEYKAIDNRIEKPVVLKFKILEEIKKIKDKINLKI